MRLKRWKVVAGGDDDALGYRAVGSSRGRDLQELTFNIYRSDTLIGGIRLTHDDDGSYELGYWLGRVHWGKGFATEACKGLLNYAAEELNIRNVKSSHMTGNDASARVLDKLGFRKTGEGEMYCLSRKATLPCIYLALTN